MSRNNQKSSEDLLLDISKKLDKMLGLLATHGRDVTTQITILHDLDWEWDEIGKYVGMSGNAARKRYERRN